MDGYNSGDTPVVETVVSQQGAPFGYGLGARYPDLGGQDEGVVYLKAVLPEGGHCGLGLCILWSYKLFLRGWRDFNSFVDSGGGNNGDRIFVLLTITVFVFTTIFNCVTFTRPGINAGSGGRVGAIICSPDFSSRSIRAATRASSGVGLGAYAISSLLTVSKVNRDHTGTVITCERRVNTCGDIRRVGGVDNVNSTACRTLTPCLAI